ncbi:MAG: hypothetical protein IIW12_04430 [Oscillospiraceae bacterium]|nr:hypothetical protein [Oscillospiraceae bacterium]
METIIERLQRYTGMNPGAPILFDDAHAKGITYAQLDDLSGRIYSWLYDHAVPGIQGPGSGRGRPMRGLPFPAGSVLNRNSCRFVC